MPLLGRLITALDQTNPRMAEIRMFSLRNADATQMATVLTQLFKLQVALAQRRAATYTLAPAEGAEGAPEKPEPAATFGSAEQDALTITVDQRTNSLLVGGTREYVELVARVIEQLDASPAEDRQTAVYRLRNANATALAQALTQFLDQERQKVVSTLGANAVGAAKELLAREVAIVAEETSNTLLISGSPRFFQTIAAMVQQLDQPPPQVLIQVLLAEVTLDDRTEFGLEWSLLASPNNRSVGVGTGFGIKSDGFTFSVSTGDFDLLLRALQSQGRLEVLSVPRIVAADNQESIVNIGQEVPYVTSSRETDTGVFNTITYRPVGIILNVTPRINPDGFVRLDVRPEISSISESTVQISEGLTATVFNRRFAQTTVTVQDGHTVIIGGLITKKEENREEKVPLLGDIPLLGALFKSTKVVKERTELLVVLTPRVLRTPADSDVLTNKLIREVGLSKGIHTTAWMGELLNPLRGVTRDEVKVLESGEPSTRPGTGAEAVVIPLSPIRNQREAQVEQPPPEQPPPAKQEAP
jgi:type II secretion system protein D